MTDEEMCWGALEPFNIKPDATIMDKSKPISHECVGKDRNCDLSSGSSRIIENKKELDNKSCRGMSICTVHNRLEYQSCTKITCIIFLNGH